MTGSRRAESFPIRPKKPIPHPFVLEAIADVVTHTKPMFGCLGVYVNEKIVFILRDKGDGGADNGVWLATTAEYHESLRREFPNMRSIAVLGHEVSHWQVLPADSPDFEESALRACDLVLARDPRIGKVPKSRGRKSKAVRQTTVRRTPRAR